MEAPVTVDIKGRKKFVERKKYTIARLAIKSSRFPWSNGKKGKVHILIKT